jgi:hypothetical protein
MTSSSAIPEGAAADERWAGGYDIGPNGTPALAAAILREGAPELAGSRVKVQSARFGVRGLTLNFAL